MKKRGHRSFWGIVALKLEIQVNKYTTDTETLATLLYAIDFNVILCTNVTKDVLK